jgi:hypothetical protein
MGCNIKFLPSVIKSLAQVCRPNSIGQKAMIHKDPAKFEQITYTVMSA